MAGARSGKRGRGWRRGCASGRGEETLTLYRRPRPQHKNLKSTNLLERLNQEMNHRTLVVRIFANTASLFPPS